MSSHDGQQARGADTGPRRWALIVIALIGTALIGMPFAFGMFAKTPKGAVMIAQFKPFMTPSRLSGFQTDLKEINGGADYLDGNASKKGNFDTAYPAFASFDKEWPGIDSKMTGLVTRVQGNLGNYLAVAALPSFRLFPWFFVIPGALILGFALVSLMRPSNWSYGRWVLVALGVGLIAAPAVFQMFGRAPKGGQMMSAFKTIETTNNVERIQGYFGEMAEGQGTIRLQIIPGLVKTGLTPSQIGSKFSAVVTLDDHWVHILNDMTPMIGAMSDNIANYGAIASLPPFPLFPWFFVLPGLIVAVLAVGAGPRARPGEGDPESVHSIPTSTTSERHDPSKNRCCIDSARVTQRPLGLGECGLVVSRHLQSQASRSHLQTHRGLLPDRNAFGVLLPHDLPGRHGGQWEVLRQSGLVVRRQELHLGAARNTRRICHGQVSPQSDSCIQYHRRRLGFGHHAASGVYGD
jgi:hypothetical protein